MVGGNPGAGSRDPDRPLLQERLRTLSKVSSQFCTTVLCPFLESCTTNQTFLPSSSRKTVFDHGDKQAMSDNNLVPDVILVASDDDNPVPVLAYKTVFEQDESSCLGMKLAFKSETATGISDAHAVNFIGCGLVHQSIIQNARGYLLGHAFEVLMGGGGSFSVSGLEKEYSQGCIKQLNEEDFSLQTTEQKHLRLQPLSFPGNSVVLIQIGRMRSADADKPPVIKM